MPRWTVSVNCFDNKNISTTHCILTFAYGVKVSKTEKGKMPLFDCYSKAFELHYQANILGVDIFTGKQMEPSEWYAPTVKDLRLDVPEDSLKRTLSVLKKIRDLSPLQAIKALNAVTVTNVADQPYYIKEVFNDNSVFLSPKEKYDVIK